MFTRFSRSWQLVKASATVLRQDKELLLFPFFSIIASLLVVATFLLPLWATGVFEEQQTADPASMAVLFLFYLIQYFIMFFFNTALVGAAMIRLDGGNPTVADGLRIAGSRIVPILGYAAIAATVGLILRAIEERAGFIGRWIVGLLGVAFTVATFLVVPILVSRDVGPVTAVKGSAALLKKTWGENVIGNGGIGLVFFLFYLGAIAIGLVTLIAVAQTGSSPLFFASLAIVIVAIIVLALVQAALQGVYSAALYRYATDGNLGEGFSGNLLSEAFKPKN